jgi:hypothetical protein
MKECVRRASSQLRSRRCRITNTRVSCCRLIQATEKDVRATQHVTEVPSMTFPLSVSHLTVIFTDSHHTFSRLSAGRVITKQHHTFKISGFYALPIFISISSFLLFYFFWYFESADVSLSKYTKIFLKFYVCFVSFYLHYNIKRSYSELVQAPAES